MMHPRLLILVCACALLAHACEDEGGGDGGAAGQGAGTGGASAGAGGASAGAGGASAGAGGASAGAGGAGGRGGAGGGEDCPPTCFRAYECAAACGETAFNNGCCPCPAGTIDVIGCDVDPDEGFCGLPCSGVRPDDEVVAACQARTSPEDCAAYSGTGFPDHCEWHTPSTPPCLAP